MTLTKILESVGWLAIGNINGHFAHPEDDAKREDPDDPMGGCCVINCGPCSALKWFSDYDRDSFEYLVGLTGFVDGWCYWDETTNGLRWDWFEAYWAQHKTCGMSNGVPTGCRFEDEELPS